MPMSWTPENDRLLLLKLIETHGISVDTAKIAAAWPDGGLKPTARAVTERFVKLRKEAGIKGSGFKPRITPSSNKFTTPKKRKVKNESEESDADDHETDEEDTPTRPSAARGGAGGRSRVRGGGGGGAGSARGGRGAMLPTRSPAMNIKSEFPSNESNAATLRQNSAQAMHLRRVAEDPFSDFGMPRNTPLTAVSSKAVDESNLSAPGMDPGDATFSNGFATAPNTPGRASLASGTGEDAPISRPRSSRKASVQASEGMSLWLHRQRSEEEEDGARSSEEDSQDSDENFNLELEEI